MQFISRNTAVTTRCFEMRRVVSRSIRAILYGIRESEKLTHGRKIDIRPVANGMLDASAVTQLHLALAPLRCESARDSLSNSACGQTHPRRAV